MANRRCLHALTRRASALLSSNPASLAPNPLPLPLAAAKSLPILRNLPAPTSPAFWPHPQFFSSDARGGGGEDDSEEDDSEGEDSDGDGDGDARCGLDSGRVYTAEEKEEEAAAIGYKVIGPLHKDDRVFKPFKPAFAVVQIGSHQFKVSNDDCIFVEKLKFCEVNDKLLLTKVLLLGTSTQTIIGRPTLPEAAVHAVVEEHALDEKVIIFKKKRRKNYRRTKGHRQELTKLRITEVQGIEIPKKPKVHKKPVKETVTENKTEEVPVAP